MIDILLRENYIPFYEEFSYLKGAIIMKTFIKDFVTITLGIIIIAVCAVACLVACTSELIYRLAVGTCAICIAAIDRLVDGSPKKKRDKKTVNKNVEAAVE